MLATLRLLPLDFPFWMKKSRSLAADSKNFIPINLFLFTEEELPHRARRLHRVCHPGFQNLQVLTTWTQQSGLSLSLSLFPFMWINAQLYLPCISCPSILHIIQNVETGVGRKSSGKLPRRLLQTLLFSHTAPADKRRRRRISLSSNLTQIAKFVLGNSQTEVDRKKKKILQQQKVWMLETFRRERTLGATMLRPSMPRSMHGKVNRRRVTWLMKKRRCNKLEFNPSHRRHPNPRPFISSQQRLQWHH